MKQETKVAIVTIVAIILDFARYTGKIPLQRNSNWILQREFVTY
jgi:hypothetical protein